MREIITQGLAIMYYRMDSMHYRIAHTSFCFMFDALTYSRGEDGLSCRHGVKPPLTHSFCFEGHVMYYIPQRRCLGIRRVTKTRILKARRIIV